MKILVTGAAGFIGMHTSLRLLNSQHDVIGLDNMNSYYDPKLKECRLKKLEKYKNFKFVKIDLTERNKVEDLFCIEKFDYVIHLAAQAGVRYSIEKPFEYTDSNITGFLTILEGCRNTNVKHLVYASSSSVYGMNSKIPFSTTDSVEHPVSLYAATKKANELMAHTYSHLYKIPTTGLRFFTVYGPYGRPDMAPWLFTEAITEGRPIKVFNNGNMERDFTYIDDIVEGIVRIKDCIPKYNESDQMERPDRSKAPYAVYNIGNSDTVKLSDFIDAIEGACGKIAEKIMLPMQPGDVPRTYADVKDLYSDIGYAPKTNIKEGIKNFVKWYESYINIERI